MTTKIQHKSHILWENGAKMPKNPSVATQIMNFIMKIFPIDIFKDFLYQEMSNVSFRM